MISIRGRGCLIQKSQAFKAPIGLSSNRSNNRDHTDPLKSNKPKLPEAFIGPETLVRSTAPAEPL